MLRVPVLCVPMLRAVACLSGLAATLALSGTDDVARAQEGRLNGIQETAQPEIITTATDRHDRMTVPVRIGDSGPWRFLVDTGAQNSVISTALAAQLGLRAMGRATLVGVAGNATVETVEVDELTLGQRTYTGLLAPVLAAGNIGADGIVGLDGLQDQRVLIDFENARMAIDEARALGGNRGFEIVVTARRRKGQLILTRAEIDGIWTDVVIDTGAETTIGNRTLQRALAQRGSNSGQAELHSVTGQRIMADLGFATALTVGRARINNIQIAFADAPPFVALDLARKPAILLGMRDLRMFRRVAIDFASRKVLFDLPREAIAGRED